MQVQVPGSTQLRALVEPYIKAGAYPKARELADGEIEAMGEKDRNLLVELFGLVEEEEKVGIAGQVPRKGSKWAKVREQICLKAREILDSNPELIVIDMVQQQAIDKGAIPDPDEDSKMRYFRLPDWNFACWACGDLIMQKNGVPWCKGCGEEPGKFWPYGGEGEDLDDAALLLNGLAKRCTGCKKPTKNKYLKSGKCPVCRGTTAQEPGRRDYGTNGGRRCDVASGPCSCGAWH